MRLHAAASLCLLVSTLAAPSGRAVRAPDGAARQLERDARFDRGSILAAAAQLRSGATSGLPPIAGPVAEPGELRQAALLELERSVGGPIEVRWDRVTGSPRLLFARTGWLSEPDPRPAESVARDFLARHHALLGLTVAEASGQPLDALVPASGGTVVHFSPRIAGLPVEHGHLVVVVADDGRVLALEAPGVGPGALDPRPRLEPVQAAELMAELLGGPAGTARPAGTTQDGALVAVEGFLDETVELQRVAFPTAWGPRLGWRSRIDAADGAAAWEIVLDDATGRLLRLVDLTRHADTRGRVFEENPDEGTHDLVRFPDTVDFRSDLAPFGWAESDQTTGNNVVARDDRDGDNEGTPGVLATAAPGPPLAFDFPYTDDPMADLDASLTQLFYGVNVAHDWFYERGFDEASGTFQLFHSGGAGLPGDPVLADAQDSSTPDNANFTPDRDGLSGRMQMGIWNTPAGDRDSAFDVGVVVHEYGHGVSFRLVGGPNDVGCLGFGQDGSMGEGWSDFFAASMFENPIIGAWISANPAGIRMFALDDNPASGKDYRDYCTAPYQDALMQCEVHANGEIWSGFLWKVREAYQGVHGPEEGAELVDRLVIDGLKLTPCTPSMLDARDALILADRLATGGAHECLIKTEAAGRWMGFSASSNGTGDVEPNATNDPWPECTTDGVVRFTREDLESGAAMATYSCEDRVEVSVTDGNAVGPLQVSLTTSGGDSEILDLSAAPDPAVWIGGIDLQEAAVVPGDGILQSASGETITVNYEEQDPARAVESMAAVDCGARLEIVRHRITNSNCDADEVDGFPGLPGFFDAGESADLVLEIGNRMPVPVQGAVYVSTDRPDLLTILPSLSPLPVDLPAATGENFPGIATVTVRALAAADFGGATDLNVELRLEATGYQTGIVATRNLRLDLDYAVETGLTIAEDVEAETGGPVGPAWTSDELTPGVGNEWTLVTCHAAEGTQAYRNGPSNCAGDYTNNQGVPWLAAPPLDFAAAGAEAARITRVEFQHDVDLYGGAGQFAVLGADGVALLASNDPAALDISQPLTLLLEALAAYANLTDFGFDSNTAGFVPQVVDVPPEALPSVDQLQPVYLTWLFYPDFFAPGFGGTAGEGYYVDDILVTYDRVITVPSGAACTQEVTVYSFPEILEPASGVACAGESVQVDAARSELALCDPPVAEYRFLVDGLPVACFDDAALLTARTQDADGWGLTPTCWDAPAGDTAYDVEVRCQAAPTPTDTRSTSVRVLDGTPILEAAPAALCAGDAQPVALDASGSALVGCPGEREYRFLDALGMELDCNGDGLPDGFGPDPTCELPAPMADLDVTLELRCDALPGCALTTMITIPVVDVTADAVDLSPPGTVHCPGLPFTVTGAGSLSSGCAGGLEYRWTGPGGIDSGWSADTDFDASLDADGSLTLEVRCADAPDCTDTVDLPLEVREGAVSAASDADAMACADTAFTLSATEDVPVDCPMGTLEYRFVADPDGDGVFEPIDCNGDGMPDDFGAADTCDTVLLVGGSEYAVQVRCTEDVSCEIESAALLVAPWDGVPVGDPQGTLRMSRTAGGCPSGPMDVTLDWRMSARMPPAFVVFRSEAADAGFAAQADVDGTSWTDAALACRDPARTPYRGADVLFYVLLDRNVCTGAPIDP